MKFNSNNFHITYIYEGIVLPVNIWLYGGLYSLEKEGENIFYNFIRADKNSYDKFIKINSINTLKNFSAIKYKEKISAKQFVNCLKNNHDTLLLVQYKFAIEKEKNQKFDCYKTSFTKDIPIKQIQLKFKNLHYIKPYFEILKSDLIRSVKFKNNLKEI